MKFKYYVTEIAPHRDRLLQYLIFYVRTHNNNILISEGWIQNLLGVLIGSLSQVVPSWLITDLEDLSFSKIQSTKVYFAYSFRNFFPYNTVFFLSETFVDR